MGYLTFSVSVIIVSDIPVQIQLPSVSYISHVYLLLCPVMQRRRPGPLQLQHAPPLRHRLPCQYT